MLGKMKTTLKLVMNPLAYRQTPFSIGILSTVQRMLQLRPASFEPGPKPMKAPLRRLQRLPQLTNISAARGETPEWLGVS